MSDEERIDVDVLIVGAGPAGLSAAIRLAQLQKTSSGPPISVAVLEKARTAGEHTLSGAVLDPSALAALIPDYRAQGAPLAAEVSGDAVYVLTKSRALRFPVVPAPLRNHGHFIVSLQSLVRWLAGRAEAEGTDIFTGFAGQEVLIEEGRVVGVRTGDRGIDRHGAKKPAFEPGVNLHAKVTIFCDGVRGNLTKDVVRRLDLARGCEPEQFAVGLKELWEVPAGRFPAGRVMHTLGYPLRNEEFGGGFIYALADGQLSLGLVAGLNYKDPRFDPHEAFNRFKQHPFVRRLLEGGRMVRYGAKALPEGGWNTIPRVHMDGGLIAGDAGGFLNSMRLKGIHLAMRTGMLAAETAFAAVREGDTSSHRLEAYQRLIDAGAVREELYKVRNVHQAFEHGLLAGLLFSGAALVSKGWWPRDLKGQAGHEQMQTMKAYYGAAVDGGHASETATVDRTATFDKATNVHYAGVSHDEDQPVHLLVKTDVCREQCGSEYGHPCTRFCPANVYEIVTSADGTPSLQINASNCVHCKTCDIMDPYGVITWVPPEGGSGPQYGGM